MKKTCKKLAKSSQPNVGHKQICDDVIKPWRPVRGGGTKSKHSLTFGGIKGKFQVLSDVWLVMSA
jgi:hypothetical protein